MTVYSVSMETTLMKCMNCGSPIGSDAVLTRPVRDVELVAAWVTHGRLKLPDDMGSKSLLASYSRWHLRAGHGPGEMLTQRRLSAALLKLGWTWKSGLGGRVYSPPGFVGDGKVHPVDAATPTDLVGEWLRYLVDVGHPAAAGGKSADLQLFFRAWCERFHPTVAVLSQAKLARELQGFGWGRRTRNYGSWYVPPVDGRPADSWDEGTVGVWVRAERPLAARSTELWKAYCAWLAAGPGGPPVPARVFGRVLLGLGWELRRTPEARIYYPPSR